MRILTKPVTFADGESFSADDLNTNLEHIQSGLDHLQSKRFVRSTMSFPFRGMTEANVQGVRTFWFIAPWNVSIERAYLRLNGTSADTILIHAVDTNSAYLTSVDDPHFTWAGSGSSENFTDFSNAPLNVAAGTRIGFLWSVADSVAFTTNEARIELHIKIDRFNLTGTELLTKYNPARFNSKDARNATAVVTEFAAIDTSVASVENNQKFPGLELYTWDAITTSTDAEFLKVRLPQVSDSEKRTLVAFYLFCEMDTASNGTSTITATLYNESAVLQGATGVDITNGLYSGSGVRIVTKTLAKAGADYADSTDDWSFILTSSLGANTITRAYVIAAFQ